MTIVNAVGNAPYLVLLPAVLRHLHLGVGSMGLTLAVTAVASVVTNLVVGQIPALPRRGITIFVMWSLIGPSTLLIAVAPSCPLIALAAARKGITFAGDTVWTSLVQEWVPREYLGRVTSLDMLGSFALLPLGFAAAAVGSTATLVLGGVVSIVVALLPLTLSSVRHLDRN